MQNDADDKNGSPELNVETAVPVFEAYLSDEEDSEAPETPAQQTPEPTQPEAVAEAEGESAEAETPDESDEESPQVFTVRVNGEDLEITLEELQRGYARQSDYTRKGQELAEHRRAFEAEAQAVRAERQLYAAQLTQLEQVLLEATPQEPDWARVQHEQPDKFPELWAQWSAHKERIAAVQRERQYAQQVLVRDQDVARQQHLAAEHAKLLEALPQWRDPQVAATDKAKLVAYTKDLGYTVEELSQVTDSRVLVLLHKAMQWDESQKKRPVIQQRIEKVKAATPGAASGATKPTTEAQKARQRLAKTGKQSDAAAAFEQLLDD